MPVSRWLARLTPPRALAAILLLPLVGFAGGLLAAAIYAMLSRSGGPHAPGYGIASGLLVFFGAALGIALAVLLCVGLRWPRVMAGLVILGSAGAWWLAGADSSSPAYRLLSAAIIVAGSTLIIWMGERRIESRRP